MKTEDIYKKIRAIAEDYHAYTDQLMAIAKWIETNFKDKSQNNTNEKQTIKMKFKDAPVGARFKYPDSDEIWVKINSYIKSAFNDGNGLIVHWKGNIQGYQSFCSFIDEEEGIDFDTEIELV